VQQISQLLGTGGIDSDHVDHNDILKLMDQYTSKRFEWDSSVKSWSIEGEPYTRNLVDSGNGNYNLVRCSHTRVRLFLPPSAHSCMGTWM
jgi:cysteine dioxygenase